LFPSQQHHFHHPTENRTHPFPLFSLFLFNQKKRETETKQKSLFFVVPERSLKTIVNKGKKKEKPKEEEGGKPSRKEEGKYKNFKGESAPAKMTILDGTSIAILHRRRPYRTHSPA